MGPGRRCWRSSCEPCTGRDLGPAQEFVRRHGLPPRTLNFDETHGAGAAGDREAIVDERAGRGGPLRPRRAQDLDAHRLAGVGNLAPGAGEWREAPDVVVDAVGGLRPVDAGFALVDL